MERGVLVDKRAPLLDALALAFEQAFELDDVLIGCAGRRAAGDARLDQLADFKHFGELAAAAQNSGRERRHQSFCVGNADECAAALATVDDTLHLERSQRLAD